MTNEFIVLVVIYFISLVVTGCYYLWSNALRIQSDRDCTSREPQYKVTYLDVIVDVFKSFCPFYNTAIALMLICGWVYNKLDEPIIKG